MRSPILLLIALTLSSSPDPSTAEGTLPQAAYQALNVALTEHHVIPRYQRLAEATKALDDTAQRFCEDQNPDKRIALEQRYNETMDAWMGVQHIQFGAGELLMRRHRFFFAPDHRNYVAEELAKRLASRDRTILDAQTFRDASVAIQGLPALEHLLFEANTVEQSSMEDEDNAYRCALITAITQNLETMAAGILEDWQAGEKPFATIVAAPGPDNAYYQTAQQATLDFFKSLHGGLQLIADIKLEPVLGQSRETARPELAESWRAKRSLRNIIVNLEALAALYFDEGGLAMTDVVQKHGKDPELDALLHRAFRMTIETGRRIDKPLRDAVKDPKTRPQVEKLAIQVIALKQIVKGRLAAALGVAVGFNALDGD